MSLLHELNQQYVGFHQAKEESFWAYMMGLSGYVAGSFENNEIALKNFSADPANLQRVREELKRTDLTPDERLGLEGWQRYFEVNTIETEEGHRVMDNLIALEGELDTKRRQMELGYIDPVTGKLVRASSVALTLMIHTSEREELRKAAWEGLRSIEPFALEAGFIEIVKERNRLGRLLGYEDYYDYKVTVNEGFSKRVLFELLDDLEVNTRDAAQRSIRKLAETEGEDAIQPWNFDYYTSGDLTAQTDPYLRFDTALSRWGVSFAAMGISYNGATMALDLVDRKGKYENGFMHGPFPGYVDNGTYRPATINFTANAVPGQMGSGKSAIKTLLHEGGHAAHFSNIMMPAPCFSQEFAPTSVALAELQSMFLDSIMTDADWLTRYAVNEAGESMPLDLIKRMLEKEHTYRAHSIRKMLAVSYAEKAIYEMAEEELTAENILRTLRDIEARLTFQPAAGRPLLSIPHLLAGNSSAYYHGYTLALMAVFQTRAYFLEKDGYIMDNRNVGRELTEKYWRPGNSRTFLQIVEDLTGRPFSAKATVDLVNSSLEDLYAEAERALERERNLPRWNEPVELDAQISVVHGDEVIASTASGASFEEVAETFGAWIRALEANVAATADDAGADDAMA